MAAVKRRRDDFARRRPRPRPPLRASTRSGRCASTPSRRRTRDIRGRRSASRRSRTRSGSASSASIRPIRSGRTATASCCRRGTPPLSSGRCCTSPASGLSTPSTRSSVSPRFHSTTSSGSGSSARSARATPSTAGRAASRRPLARWARASPPRSAWRSQASGSERVTTATASRCSTSTSTPRRATAA